MLRDESERVEFIRCLLREPGYGLGVVHLGTPRKGLFYRGIDRNEIGQKFCRYLGDKASTKKINAMLGVLREISRPTDINENPREAYLRVREKLRDLYRA